MKGQEALQWRNARRRQCRGFSRGVGESLLESYRVIIECEQAEACLNDLLDDHHDNDSCDADTIAFCDFFRLVQSILLCEGKLQVIKRVVEKRCDPVDEDGQR